MNRKEIYFIFRKEVVQMDALVEGLMEELNCETVFTIPLFGGIPVYESVVVTWIIMAVVFLLCILLSRNLRKPQSQTGSCRNSNKGAQ